MEIRILIFIILVFVTVTTNTALIWFAYKAFANMAMKATEAVSDFQMSGKTRQWLQSIEAAATQAVAATEAAKRAMAEFEPVMNKTQESYSRTLVNVDSKLEKVADDITASAKKMRDVVAKPAFSAMAFAAGLTKVLETMQSDE